MDETIMMKINKISKMWRDKTRKMTNSFGIPESYRPVLFYVDKNPGCMQKDVCDNSRFKASTISQTIKDMIINGFIEKKIDDNDSRVFNLYLTDTGKNYVKKIRAKLREYENELLKELKNKDEISNYLDLIINIMDGDDNA